MFERLKMGIEFKNLANSLNKIAEIANDINMRMDISKSYSVFYLDILSLAYVARKGVLDRNEKYTWPLNTALYVPSLSSKVLYFGGAFQVVMLRLNMIAERANLSDEVQEILEYGSKFYEIEKIISNEYKSYI